MKRFLYTAIVIFGLEIQAITAVVQAPNNMLSSDFG